MGISKKVSVGGAESAQSGNPGYQWGPTDSRRRKLSKHLEMANFHLGESKDYFADLYDPETAEALIARVYALQFEIHNLKALVKT